MSSDVGAVEGARRLRLADRAYDAIRSLILSGRIGMGERLVEAQLAEALKVSRAPVREAMQRLVSDGLVEDLAHHGAVVRLMTPQDIADIYNVRLGLESVSVRLFIAQSGDPEPMRAAISRMSEAADVRDTEELVQADLAFHRAIAAAARGPLVSQLLASLEARMLMVLSMDNSLYARSGGKLVDEHARIAGLIEAGDGDAAVAAMRDHIVSAASALLELPAEPRPLILERL